IANLDRSLPFAALALLLAAIFALATENLLRREHRPGIGAASAFYATGALAALALALTFALEKGWLTIALACRHHGCGGDRACRLGAPHRRRRPRHGAHLQLAALRLRRARGVVLARGMAVASPARRPAGPHGRRRRHSVHGAAGGSRNPPLRHGRRHVPDLGRA